MEQVRSFVAIELPEGLKLELDDLVERLTSHGQSGVRWVDPHSIHLTLKFLGDVAVDRLDDIAAALTESVRGIFPFRLGLGGLGVFPNPKRVRVAWVGVSGETDKLRQLQRQVESTLENLGFAAESRPFTPHLTLARLRDRVSADERARFGQLIDATPFEARHAIDVDAINLMRSQLTRQGAVYSRINSIKLGRR